MAASNLKPAAIILTDNDLTHHRTIWKSNRGTPEEERDTVRSWVSVHSLRNLKIGQNSMPEDGECRNLSVRRMLSFFLHHKTWTSSISGEIKLHVDPCRSHVTN